MSASLYFIHGKENYLIAEHIKQIISEVNVNSKEEAECVSYYGDELSPERLAEVLVFSPLFASTRVVIIKNMPGLGTDKRKRRAPTEYLQVLEQYVRSQTELQTVIFTVEEFQAQNDMAKLLLKNAVVISCPPLNQKERVSWLQGEVQKLEMTMQKDAIELLAGSAYNMFHIKHIVDKLYLQKQKERITKRDLEDEWLQQEQIKVFKLLDAIISKNLAASMEAYRQLERQGEHQIALIFMLVRRFILLGKVKALQEKRFDSNRIAAETGQQYYVIRSIEGKTKLFSWEQLSNMNQMLLQADLLFKTSRQDPNLLMECLIIEICQML